MNYDVKIPVSSFIGQKVLKVKLLKQYEAVCQKMFLIIDFLLSDENFSELI